MTSIEFVDLKAQQRKILSYLEQHKNNVMYQGRYILGSEIKELEEILDAYLE